MKVRKLQVSDVLAMMAEPSFKGVGATVTPELIEVLAKSPDQYTAVADDGRIVAVAGFLQYWPGRGEVWAMVSNHAKRDFVELHSVAKRLLRVCPFRRLEAAVELDFEMGHRWVKALGFRKEAERLQAYLPNGKDCALYARVA